MRLQSIIVKNYRPFKVLEETKLGQMATIVGKNDSGKSSILHALELFFETIELEPDDIHEGTATEEEISVEVSFAEIPDVVQIEDGIDTTFKEELMLDENGCLRLRKVFDRDGKVAKIILISKNFLDDYFADLVRLKETDLNRKCKEKNIEATKSGRGITNKEKRNALRSFAVANSISTGLRELEVSKKDDLWKTVSSLLPSFDLFESEHKTDVADTSFQKEFRPIVEAAARNPDVAKSKEEFTGSIEKALQTEMDQICEKLKRHTDAVTCLTVKPIFSWEKAVTLQVSGKDKHGIDKLLEKRGAGIRRLLMVAFFEHLAEKKEGNKRNLIFGLEEPENGLHPGLQRELIDSFRQLAKQGFQIIITTHSPVFTGASPIDQLTLITRESGVAKATQTPSLDLADVAKELGVEPSDQIMGYKACIFVEGQDDILFWQTIVATLKAANVINSTFDEKAIGLIPFGGSNLKFWVNMSTMKKLNRRFAVIVDSDREKAEDNIPQTKLDQKTKCEQDGGIFLILRKREIENYLHDRAIAESGRPMQPHDDFSDMKKLFGENVFKVITNMTSAEILEMDKFTEGAIEHHELKENVDKLLALA